MKLTLRNCLSLLLLSSLWSVPGASGQNRGDPQYQPILAEPVHKSITHDATMLQDSWQKNPNPFRPGSDLRASDIKCSIVEWDNTSPKPVLTVVCPPPGVFTPLRVFLKFSWMDTKDVPKDVAKVVAEPRAGTKIQFDRANIKVFLKLSQGAQDSIKEKWMAFNALQGFAIIPSETVGSKNQ